MSLTSDIIDAMILPPAIMAAVSFKRQSDKGESLFSLQIFWWLLLNLATNVWVKLGLGYTHFMYNISYLIEGLLLSYVLLFWIGQKDLLKNYLYIALSYLLIWIVFISFYGISFINQEIIYVENSFLCGLSGYLLVKMAFNEASLFLNFKFWAAGGIFISYLINIEIETLLKFLNSGGAAAFTILSAVIGIVSNLLYTIAFLCKYRETRRQLSW